MWPVEGNPASAPALDRRARLGLLAGGAAVVLAVVVTTIAAIRASGPGVPAYGVSGAGVARLWLGDAAGFHAPAATAAGPRSNHIDAAFDPARGILVAWDHGCARLVMGFTGGCQESINQTWTWDGRAWTEHASAAEPESGAVGVMGYDGRLGAAVFANRAGQAWRWNGAGWSPLALSLPGELVRAGVIAVGIPGDGRLLFVAAGSTWTWSGGAWTRQEGGIDPADARPESAQLAAGQVYVGKRITWVREGGAWTPRAQPNWVAPAYAAAGDGITLLAEDPDSCDRSVCQSVTWTWSGSAWMRRSSGPTFPLNASGAYPAALVSDPSRHGFDVLVSAA